MSRRSRKTQQRYLSAHPPVQRPEPEPEEEPEPLLSGRQQAHVAPPTITQVRTIASLNARMGTSYAVPASETDARFLIDGMVSEDRNQRSRRRTK